MTKREFLQAVTEIEGVNEEIKAFAEKEIDSIDVRLEKAKAKRAEKKAADQPLYDKIGEILTDKPQIASEIAEVLGVSTQKTSALLRTLVGEGKVAKETVKVPKRGMVIGYKLA